MNECVRQSEGGKAFKVHVELPQRGFQFHCAVIYSACVGKYRESISGNRKRILGLN